MTEQEELELARARLKLVMVSAGKASTDDEPVPQLPEERPYQAALQGFGSGATYGFLPWLQAKADSIAQGALQVGEGETVRGLKNIFSPQIGPTQTGDFEANLQQWKARDQRLYDENKEAYVTNAILGGLMTPLPGGAAAKSATIGQRAIRSALIGAGSGALSGIGESMSSGASLPDSIGPIAVSTGFGAGLGGVFGLAGAKMSDEMQSAAGRAPEAAEAAREFARQHAAKAALRPYYSDSKEMMGSAERALSNASEIPGKAAFSEAGEYLINENLVPGVFSSAEKTAKALAARQEAAGALMGEALNKADEFLAAWGIKGVPLERVASQVERRASQVSGELGNTSQAKAVNAAAERIRGVTGFDRPRTLTELQKGATSAYGDVNFAAADIDKFPALEEARAYKRTIRDVLGQMAEPDFKGRLSGATASNWRAPAKEPGIVVPTGQKPAPIVVNGEVIYPRELASSAMPARDSFTGRELTEGISGLPRLPEATGNKLARWATPGELIPEDVQLARANIKDPYYSWDARKDFSNVFGDEWRPREIPAYVQPEARWTDVSNLINLYNEGAKGYGTNKALLDVAAAGEQRRFFNRMQTPTVKGAALAGAAGGLGFGGPVGALAGGAILGGAAGLAQSMADPLAARAGLSAERFLRNAPALAESVAGGMRAYQPAARVGGMAADYLEGPLMEYFRAIFEDEGQVKRASPEQGQENFTRPNQ